MYTQNTTGRLCALILSLSLFLHTVHMDITHSHACAPSADAARMRCDAMRKQLVSQFHAHAIGLLPPTQPTPGRVRLPLHV